MPWTHGWGEGGEDDAIAGCAHHRRLLLPQRVHDGRGLTRGLRRVGRRAGRTSASLRSSIARARRCARARGNTVQPRAVLRRDPRRGAAPPASRCSPTADDPPEPVGIAPVPATSSTGKRWNAAFAYLDPARARPNLSISDGTLVDRVLLDGSRAVGVVCADGRRFEADTVMLAAGAYFSPAMLCAQRHRARERAHAARDRRRRALPVGERLLDHCGTSVALDAFRATAREASRRTSAGTLSSLTLVVEGGELELCSGGTWDLPCHPVRAPERGARTLRR